MRMRTSPQGRLMLPIRLLAPHRTPSLPSPIRLPHPRSYSMATPDIRSKNPLVGLSPAVRARAEPIVQQWKGTSASGEPTKNFIGGQFVESKTTKWIDVLDPVSPRRNYFAARNC